MGGRYDFDLKFATSVWSREAEKERQLQLYGLDIQNPLVMQNPRALWMITQRVHKALGDDNFGDLIPEPPNIAMPRTPREEWAMALQGEPIDTHPDDNDELHVRQHTDQMSEEHASERPDEPALKAMLEHIQAHQAQHSQKLLRQVLTNQLVNTFAQNAQTGQGLQPGGQPMDIARLQATLQQLMVGGSGIPGPPAGQPGAQPPASPGSTEAT
jgi:hypothetical protein